MIDFSKGKWNAVAYDPERVTLNGKEYIVVSEGSEDTGADDLVLLLKQADARLVVAAPEMYEVLELCGDVLEAVDVEFKAYGVEREDVSALLQKVDALLRRIDSKEASHE